MSLKKKVQMESCKRCTIEEVVWPLLPPNSFWAENYSFGNQWVKVRVQVHWDFFGELSKNRHVLHFTQQNQFFKLKKTRFLLQYFVYFGGKKDMFWCPQVDSLFPFNPRESTVWVRVDAEGVVIGGFLKRKKRVCGHREHCCKGVTQRARQSQDIARIQTSGGGMK